MGSDRARRSYDSSKAYRSVVMQQGRAFVEADWNEQQEIVSEEMRLATLDIVGPAGAVGDGFNVAFLDGRKDDFKICAGTVYVGGLRVTLDHDLTYRDHINAFRETDDRACVGKDLVYLEVTEQEVSAVEDTELKDAALGGPDTAQRVRLMQRIRRHPVEAKSSEEAIQELRTYWEGHGLVWHHRTMQLHSRAQLQVAFDKLDEDKETGAGAGGVYLRDENQLIRVRITGHAKYENSHGGTLAWAYNNASDLYRITVAGSGEKDAVRLESRPVDDYHQPIRGQTVEILRTIGYLPNGEPIAADHGHITAVDTEHKLPYDPDSQILLLSDKLPAEYADEQDRPLFLRIWEENKEFVAGRRVALGDTGLFVTLGLTMDGDGGGFQVGDFWVISVRPGTPTIIYPGRILKEPQPPDGPRRWICALARIDWDGSDGPRLHDCRHRIQDLVTMAKTASPAVLEITKEKRVVEIVEPVAKQVVQAEDQPIVETILDTVYRTEVAEASRCCCCDRTVTPDDLYDTESLRSILDNFEGSAMTVCLLPGKYPLKSPLRLTAGDFGVTLKGCGSGVVLTAKSGYEDRFLDGLIVLDGSAAVTLANLSIAPPIVPIAAAHGLPAGLDFQSFTEVYIDPIDDFNGSVGLRLVNAPSVTVDGCEFEIPVGDRLFAVGILAGGDCSGIKLRDSRFERKAERAEIAQETYNLSIGCAAVTSLTFSAEGKKIVTGRVLATRLASAEFRGNSFANLDAAALIYADTGKIVVRENAITECHAGVWMLAARSLPFFDADTFIDIDMDGPSYDAYKTQVTNLHESLKSAYDDPVIRRGLTMARIYPLPQAEDRAMEIHDRLTDMDERDEIAALMRKGLESRMSAVRNFKEILDRLVLKRPKVRAPKGLTLFDRVRHDLAAVERAYHDYHLDQKPLTLVLQAEGNRILPRSPVHSSIGLFVWDDANDRDSMATVNSNIVRIQSESASAVTMVGIFHVAVSGNLLLKSPPEGDRQQPSLVYYGGTVGITANP